jgi:hypothetical protein
MSERIDFWRGFAGGLLVGVVVGAFTYFSPKDGSESRSMPAADQADELNRGQTLQLKREAAENAGDPARLLPDAGKISRIDFERPGQPA